MSDSSSSSSDRGRPTSPAPSSTTPPPPPPPKREPFFDTVRRISDYQFSTLLHALIGLPSSLTPPATSGWILDDDLDPSETPRPRTVRSGSDSILEEVRKLRDDEERKGGGGGGGMGIPRSMGGAAAGPTAGSDAKREIVGLGELFGFPSPLDVFRGFEEMHRDLLRPMLSERPAPSQGPTTTDTSTELDYYSFFERQFRRPPPAPPAQGGDNRRVVETITETRSFTGPDGVTKTRRVEVKRFSDGTEERKEKERTTLPTAPNSGDVGRITEVAE